MFYVQNKYALADQEVFPQPVNFTGILPGGEVDDDDDYDDDDEEDDIPGISEGDAAEEALPEVEEEDIEWEDIDVDEDLEDDPDEDDE